MRNDIFSETVPYIYIYGTVSAKMSSFYNIIVLLKCFLFESIYLPNAKRYRFPIFNTSYYAISIQIITFWSLTLAPHQYCNVRYPTGFKPFITLGRSNQITSKSVCRYRGPIPIDLFCSLIFMPFVTEIHLNKVRPLFPLDSRQ